jgi:hypothetical protein
MLYNMQGILINCTSFAGLNISATSFAGIMLFQVSTFDTIEERYRLLHRFRSLLAFLSNTPQFALLQKQGIAGIDRFFGQSATEFFAWLFMVLKLLSYPP